MKFDPLKPFGNDPYRGHVPAHNTNEQRRIQVWETERRIARLGKRARRYALAACFFAGLSMAFNIIRCVYALK